MQQNYFCCWSFWLFWSRRWKQAEVDSMTAKIAFDWRREGWCEIVGIFIASSCRNSDKIDGKRHDNVNSFINLSHAKFPCRALVEIFYPHSQPFVFNFKLPPACHKLSSTEPKACESTVDSITRNYLSPGRTFTFGTASAYTHVSSSRCWCGLTVNCVTCARCYQQLLVFAVA